MLSVFDSLSEQIKFAVGKKGPGVFAVPGLLKIIVVQKPATKAHKGINPFAKQEQFFKDEDPDTKMQTVVSKIAAHAVVITSSNNSSGRACVYDLATGIQTAWAESDGPTQTFQTMRRQMNGQ